MFLRAVVYSKVTEMKLMLYDSDPNNARIRIKDNTFRSMNPMYGRERKFSRSTQYYNAKFPLKCKHKLYVSFSNTSTISRI
jgi:hypothetical protein